MRSQFDLRSWAVALWRNPSLFAVAFVLGGATAFAYSYAPLHRAKDWQINYLEGRVESRDVQAKQLEADLEEALESLTDTPSGEELRGMRAQLAEDSALVDSRQRDIDRLTAKLGRMTRSRDSWKSRHADAIARIEERREAEDTSTPSAAAVGEAPAAVVGGAPAAVIGGEPAAVVGGEPAAAPGDTSPKSSPPEPSADSTEPLPASPAPEE